MRVRVLEASIPATARAPGDKENSGDETCDEVEATSPSSPSPARALLYSPGHPDAILRVLTPTRVRDALNSKRASLTQIKKNSQSLSQHQSCSGGAAANSNSSSSSSLSSGSSVSSSLGCSPSSTQAGETKKNNKKKKNTPPPRPPRKLAAARPVTTGPSGSSTPQPLWERVCQEIQETEASYAAHLRVLADDFIPAVGAALARAGANTGGGGGGGGGGVPLLFGNVEQLCSLSVEFQANLAEALLGGRVGAAYKRTGPHFKLYTEYCQNHGEAVALVARLCKSSKELRETVLRCERECGRGQTLLSLLIMPIQRVPRHILLLRELIKRLPEGHADVTECEEGLACMEKVGRHINDTMRKRENAVKVWQIQSSLSVPTTSSSGAGANAGDTTGIVHANGSGKAKANGSANANANASEGMLVADDADKAVWCLLETNRVFELEGELSKLCGVRRQRRRRKFFLFSDCLVYARPSASTNLKLGNKWQFRGKFSVQAVRHGFEDNSFVVVTGADTRNVTCVADDAATKQLWVEALEDNIRRRKASRIAIGADLPASLSVAASEAAGSPRPQEEAAKASSPFESGNLGHCHESAACATTPVRRAAASQESQSPTCAPELPPRPKRRTVEGSQAEKPGASPLAVAVSAVAVIYGYRLLPTMHSLPGMMLLALTGLTLLYQLMQANAKAPVNAEPS